MISTSEEQRSMNLEILDEGESELPFGNANGDVEIGNIQDPVQFLLHSAKNYSNINSPSIHMVPSRIRDLNPKVFNPRWVSIGPLHRNNKNLQAFEGQKAIFLHDLLDQTGLPQEQTLEKCVEKVKASIGRIKACYGNGIEWYSDDDITKMMVMDACFILEFLYKKSKDLFDENMVIEPRSVSYDLLLIENQIPFFVLQDIFDCTSSRFEQKVPSLHFLIIHGCDRNLQFLKSRFKIKKDTDFTKTGRYSHILALIHEVYNPIYVSQSPDSETKYSAVKTNKSSSSRTFSSSTVELDRAGVNFKPHHHSSQRWSMDIKFEFPLYSWCRPWAKPTLRMPMLRIHNYTELILRNLIAYEHLSPYGLHCYFTSYAIAMDRLIDTHEDVAILVKSKVLVNTIGSDEEAAKLINDMRKDISCRRFLYKDVWKEMNEYHNKVWPRNIAQLRRTYFSNPWSIIALLAGIFLFIFTIVQTYFTINPV